MANKKTTSRGNTKKTTKKRTQTATQKRTKVRSGTKGVERSSKRAAYPKSYRVEVAQMVDAVGSIREVAKQYGLETRLVKKWHKQFGSPIGSEDSEVGTNREDGSPVAASDSSKNNGATSTNANGNANANNQDGNGDHGTPLSSSIDTNMGFVDHEERKRTLAHLFTVMDRRVQVEGMSMSESQLKAIATGMAIVSDKIDLLNAKENGLPKAPSGKQTELPMPSNVVSLLPKPKPKMELDDGGAMDGNDGEHAGGE